MTIPPRLIRVVLISGMIAGALCSRWDWVMVITGWYKDVSMSNAALLFIPLLLLGLLLGLRRTSREGLRFRGQVLAGVVMAMVAALVIAVNVLGMTGAVVPSYFADQQEVHRQILRQAGKTDAEIAAALAAHPVMSAGQHARSALMAVTVMGSVGSALLSVFVRSRGKEMELRV